ncbi:MAG: flagellar biosynthetic protein FliR [Fibrobacterota bacterium]
MPELTLEQIEVFLLSFIRIVTFLYFMPVFDQKFMPVQYRIGLAFFLAVLLFDKIFALTDLPAVTTYWGYAFVVVRELILAVVVGFMFKALFAAVSFAGRIIDMQLGFAMLQLPDPILQGERTSATGMLQILLFSMVFLVANGHYYLFIALGKSFELIPPGEFLLQGATIPRALIMSVTNMMEIALRLALPILSLLLVTSMTLGVVAKTMPQMNIFFVGMPLKIGIGFISLYLVLPVLVTIFQKAYMNIYRDVWALVKTMAGT